MRVAQLPKKAQRLTLSLAILAAIVHAAPTDISSVPLNTYSATTSVDVKPNILFVLDDSGSMDWDYMPDWANDRPGNYSSLPNYLSKNSAFNGIAYNPAITYSPPVAFNADGSRDTTRYPSMNGQSAASGADSSSKPNWKAVPNDGFGVQSTSTNDLVDNAYFYTIVPGEYCNAPNLRNCTSATAPSGTYAYPAYLRWCTSSSLSTCQAAWSNTGTSYRYPRIPAPRIATINVTSASSAVATSIIVDGSEILSASTASSGDENTVASRIAANINACTNKKTGNCTAVGYSATRSGSTVTIYAPGTTSATPALSKTGTLNATISAFARSSIPLPAYLDGSASSTSIPGENLRTAITASINSYPYPGTAAKASTRTDCAGTTCTYEEEMTNYANWWAYYRTRMQMMKTSSSRAFAAIDKAEDITNGVSRFRVGYLSINNNNSDFVNLGEFKSAQKQTWFNKLFAANPVGGTPLRAALSTAGQLFAGKLNGTTLNGSTVTDPLLYSCQQNYTILSSDGFWNGDAGSKLDGSTAIGNQDGLMPRPYNDGATSVLQTRTSQLQSRTNQMTAEKGTLQRCTSNCWWNGNWNNVTSCTPGGSTQCRYSFSSSAATSTCSPAYAAGNYSNSTVYRNCNTTGIVGTWNNANSCTATTTPNASGQTTECRYNAWTSWATVASCNPVPQSTAPNYTVAVARECQGAASGGTSNTLADVAAYYYNTDLRNANATGTDATGTCTGPVIPPSTTANNLCRDDVPTNGRDTSTRQHMTTFTLGLGAQGRMIYSTYQNDTAGNRNYYPDYWLQPSGDFYDVANGTPPNTANGICSWMTSGNCTWPTPASDSIANIDDLWHAAVNGRGSYFSATDPQSLATGLAATLKAISDPPRPGTAAAAASSNPNVSSSDNYVFSSSYRSVEWFGELIRQQISTETHTLSEQQWSAMQLLDCAMTAWQANRTYAEGDVYKQGSACYKVNSAYTSGSSFAGETGGIDGQNTETLGAGPVTRNIYFAGTSGLSAFNWSNLTSTQQAYFTTPHINFISASQGLTQFCTSGVKCLSGTAQTAASGENLVRFLIGERNHEGAYFRTRTHVLGDIISSEARYVKKPMYEYNDSGYADFKAKHATRAGTVYVGANDGMLHAFDAETGKENWAFIPTAVLPNLYKLADVDYGQKHQFYVDATPEVGDICPTAPATACNRDQWRTILVGGLNSGGKAFYALDVTDPASPSLLWEFTDDNLGYTYSNPRITKLKNGTWVVMFASGYNNADGIGRLYVVNAHTGAPITSISANGSISTGVGSVATPSGLTKISAHAPTTMSDNTVSAVYGGDVLGNLWRFDVNGDIGASGYDAHLLVSLVDGTGKAQPITAKPSVTTINNNPVVYVGTGRYLGLTDVSDDSPQSLYAVKDNLNTTTLGNPRLPGSNFVQQTLTETSCPEGAPTSVCSPGETVRTTSSNAVDWYSKNGWYMDFLTAGERASSDSVIGLGTVVFTTIRPKLSSASACGDADTPDSSASYMYALDYLTGSAVTGNRGVAAISLGLGLATRPVLVKFEDGSVRALIRTTGGSTNGTDQGRTVVEEVPTPPGTTSPLRRVSWRLLDGK